MWVLYLNASLGYKLAMNPIVMTVLLVLFECPLVSHIETKVGLHH